MEDKVKFFENGDYRLITNLINEKIGDLRKYKNFNDQYVKLYDKIDELQLIFDDNQQKEFNEIIQLFYDIEEYYLALAYSLGIKYGKDLEKL